MGGGDFEGIWGTELWNRGEILSAVIRDRQSVHAATNVTSEAL